MVTNFRGDGAHRKSEHSTFRQVSGLTVLSGTVVPVMKITLRATLPAGTRSGVPGLM